MVDIAANYREVLERMGEAAVRSGRDPKEIKLLAACKSQSVEKIRAAAAAGIRLFGENYVQEAEAKKSALDATIEWHMIGHLQRNKVKTALGIFDLIQSLDSVELARALDKEAKARGRAARAYVEVNLAAEQTKSGIPSNRVAPLLEEIAKLPYIRIEGLMAVPPLADDAEKARPYFRALAELRAELKPLEAMNIHLAELSMGMTNDFSVAIEEGATLVRIGTAIFGPRGA
jgi:pyridoxal phosphate enzyme (YggS family)